MHASCKASLAWVFNPSVTLCFISALSAFFEETPHSQLLHYESTLSLGKCVKVCCKHFVFFHASTFLEDGVACVMEYLGML
jgi:hypothetical protein